MKEGFIVGTLLQRQMKCDTWTFVAKPDGGSKWEM